MRRRPSSKRSQLKRCRFESLEPRLAFTAIQDWQIRGAGGGGALFSPSFNPTNPNDIYIASDMGQIFHTTNDGTLWDTVDFRQVYGGHNAKVQFTSNPQILYTIDYSNGGDVVQPTKSTDGGANWNPVADPTDGGAITLVADYNNPNRLIVSDYSHLFVSTDGGATFNQRFSTADGAGLHIGGAFFDGNNIYVGTNQGVLVSSNGGTSFSVAGFTGIPSGQKIVSFAGAKETVNNITTTRFWIVTANSGDVFAGVQAFDGIGYAGIYRIDVGQTAWTSIGSTIPSGSSPNFVSAAMNDINTVYVAGGSSSERPTVFRSTTGGTNWQSVLQTVNNANVQTGWSGDGGVRGWSYGELAMGFEVSPLDSTRLVITDYGFAHISEDSGDHWRALYVTPDDLNPAGANIPAGQTYKSSGLDNTTSWDLNWTSPTHIIGGFADVRSEVSNDGGATWSFNYTGFTSNAMYRSVVGATGTVYAAISSVHDMYQSTYLTDARIDGGSGAVLFSTNGGTTWQTMHDFGDVVTWVETDPTNLNRLYAADANSSTGGIYVTNNAQAGASSTWTKLTPPPRTQGHAFNIRVLNDGTLVVTYSGRPDSAGAFTASSGVFVSIDGGQTWQDRSDPGMLYWTKDVVIDPHDATQNTWYVSVFSGWGGPPNGLGGLYRTTDRGVQWAKINTLDRVNSVTVCPTNANEAYLTTETQGLWYTQNLQAASPAFTEVTGYKFMQPMRVFYNPYNASDVWVTSFGGGLRVGNVNSTTTQRGDFNRDSQVTPTDLDAMLAALVDLTAYKNSKGVSDAQLTAIGDFNSDGRVSNADIQGMLDLLISTGNGARASAENQTGPAQSAADNLLVSHSLSAANLAQTVALPISSSSTPTIVRTVPRSHTGSSGRPGRGIPLDRQFLQLARSNVARCAVQTSRGDQQWDRQSIKHRYRTAAITHTPADTTAPGDVMACDILRPSIISVGEAELASFARNFKCRRRVTSTSGSQTAPVIWNRIKKCQNKLERL